MSVLRVVVTGGSGFIGSAVVEVLRARGHRITVVDDLSKPRRHTPEGVGFVRADVTDPRAAIRALEGQEACIHLAARIGGIGYFHKYPATILGDNARMCGSVFAGAARVGIRRLVYVSSSMVFEAADRFPCREEDLLRVPMPRSAYGFAKLLGEKYCEAFLEEHGLCYSICRPFNAYGRNEWPEEEPGIAHVIPDLVKKVLRGDDPVEIFGDGRQTRCYTHVTDIAAGIAAALESPAAENQSFNISDTRETGVLELLGMIWKACGRSGAPRVRHLPAYRYDVPRRVPDTRKAAELLGWHPRVRLDDGLADVVLWLREVLGGEGPGAR